MDDLETLIQETRNILRRPVTLPHQASSVAMNIFLMSTVHDAAEDPRVRSLRENLREVIQSSGMDNLLERQLSYASRLASAPGELLYEEMHKLFSLCDEIHALGSLGFSAEAASRERFERDVRARFLAEPKAARLAASYNVEPWNRDLWWYADNLRDNEDPGKRT